MHHQLAINHLFKSKQALDIWNTFGIIDIKPLGPAAPEDGDADEAEDADHFPDPKLSKDQTDRPDQRDNKQEVHFTNDG